MMEFYLPRELLLHCLSWLTDRELLLSVSLVNSQFKELAEDDEALWKPMCRAFGSKPKDMSWLQWYKAEIGLKWDPNYCGPHFKISPDGKTVTHANNCNGDCVVLATRGWYEGTHYWEVTVNRCERDYNNLVIGIATRDANLDGYFGQLSRITGKCATWGLYMCEGTLWGDDTFRNMHKFCDRYDAGDTIGLLLELGPGPAAERVAAAAAHASSTSSSLLLSTTTTTTNTVSASGEPISLQEEEQEQEQEQEGGGGEGESASALPLTTDFINEQQEMLLQKKRSPPPPPPASTTTTTTTTATTSADGEFFRRLSYFKNGKYLGTAFGPLPSAATVFYPAVSALYYGDSMTLRTNVPIPPIPPTSVTEN